MFVCLYDYLLIFIYSLYETTFFACSKHPRQYTAAAFMLSSGSKDEPIKPEKRKRKRRPLSILELKVFGLRSKVEKATTMT